ncbi:MAG: FAD-binding oxidoreductase [Nanoarchaeota archaeon]|nr:FAD-binding oxidoreductase [Nanoarchaeota archaeon]
MIKKIRDIFQNDVSDSEEDKLVYSYDASNIHQGEADLIVWPKSVLQIRKLISLANRSHFDIVLRGAGTGLVGGTIPQKSVVVDLSKMNKILKFDPERKIIIVEPGVILNDLNNAIKKFNLFFPVIPSSHKVCTIGGMIATNAAGNRALKFGRCANWIKSIIIVDGTGKHIPVKDVVRFAGTEGTVAVIVQAELKLIPIIEKTTMDVFKFKDISDLMAKIKELKSNPSLLSLEFIDKTASRLSDVEEFYRLFAEYSDFSGSIEEKEEIEKIWNYRESFGQILASKGYVLTEDPQIPEDKLPIFIDWLRKNNIPSFGHIGIGIIHPRFKHHSEKLIKEMFNLVLKLGGNISGEHGIGLAKKVFVSKEFKQRIIELKRKYDPKDILNRGKII